MPGETVAMVLQFQMSDRHVPAWCVRPADGEMCPSAFASEGYE